MTKIAVVGAGSGTFARKLINDILCFPALNDVHFALMDIDAVALGYSKRIAERLISERKLDATVSATTNRKEALKGADFVIISILTNGREPIKVEYEIPFKHGVDQCIGDTLGPGGVFRFLRTAPAILDICRDTLDYANPDALILNYTNPMAMLTWAAYASFPEIKFVGLCHSVQNTTGQLADALKLSHDSIRYHVAGINHQAWVLKFEHIDGRDLYPSLRENLPTSNLYVDNEERVRIEMMKHLGYFVTESSGHNSEYNPWFRKRKDLLEKYTGQTWAGESGYLVKCYCTIAPQDKYEQSMEDLITQKEPLSSPLSEEYGSYIINAVCTDVPYRIYGNVKNTGLISNLPHGCCVEVPCMIDAQGVSPVVVGDLPPQCAALNRTNVNVQELAVKALLEKSRELIYQALYFDPLTSACLSLQEIRDMADDLFNVENNKNWLPKLS